MDHRTATLLELTLAEQEARNAAALAAIRSRSADIAELQRLVESLAARGLHVRPAVSTAPIGAQASCRLHVWLSGTKQELYAALDWLIGADIGVTRYVPAENGRLHSYELTLRASTIQLNATLHDAQPARGAAPFQPAAA